MIARRILVVEDSSTQAERIHLIFEHLEQRSQGYLEMKVTLRVGHR